MVSSQGGVEEILAGMSAGVDDYLVKPLDSDELEPGSSRRRASPRSTASSPTNAARWSSSITSSQRSRVVTRSRVSAIGARSKRTSKAWKRA